MTSPFRGRALAAGALMLPALALAACGSSSKSTSSSATTGGKAKTTSTTAAKPTPASGGSAAGSVLKVSADAGGQLKFDTTALKAKAGNVTITMTNPSSLPHSIALEGNGVDKAAKVKLAGQGQTATVSAKLKPGTYTFYCPVTGHKQAGMKGTLTVS
jgi:plastocyanin